MAVELERPSSFGTFIAERASMADGPTPKWVADTLRDTRLDVSLRPPKPEPILYINGVPLCTPGSISTIIGRAKGGKTSLTVLLVASVLAWSIDGGLEAGKITEGRRVAFLDTEQGPYYASQTLSRINAITGGTGMDRLDYFDWRTLSWQERRALLPGVLERGDYCLVIIDGARDLVPGINIEEEATSFVTEIMQLSTEYKTHILSILHQNKNDGNARGHLGTELMNKSETVIEVNLDPKSKGFSIASPYLTRGLPFDPIGMGRNADGVPYILPSEFLTQSGTKRKAAIPCEISVEAHGRVLRRAVPSEGMPYGKLRDALVVAFGVEGIEVSKFATIKFVQYYVEGGTLIKLEAGDGRQYPLYRLGELESLEPLANDFP